LLNQGYKMPGSKENARFSRHSAYFSESSSFTGRRTIIRINTANRLLGLGPPAHWRTSTCSASFMTKHPTRGCRFGLRKGGEGKELSRIKSDENSQVKEY
jgi:hypothetical protein